MQLNARISVAAMALLLTVFFAPSVRAAPEESVEANVRCPVCGMFVAKYDNWIAQIRLADGKVLFFDGVKDLLVFYFQPQRYSKATGGDIREIWVKDYYTLSWIDGRKALYVIGSDVYGPMGRELIPFAGRDAAQNFMQDHRGRKIIEFEEITEELVQSMRAGARMQHGVK